MTNSMDMVNTNHQGGGIPRKIYATPISVTYNGVPSEFRDNANHYMEGMFQSDNQSGTVFIRISVPDLKLQKCLQFELDETVWQAKQRLLSTFAKDLKDAINFGLYCPPVNGRAGKFLEEERSLREYPLQGPIGFLEFKYKRRVYKIMHVNPRKLKQLNTKGSQKHFMDYVKSCNVEKVTKLTNKGLDPNFHDSHSGETPLSTAVTLTKQKCRELMISLAGGGAHLDYRTRKGMTPLHKAVLAGNTEAVKTLLDLGVSPNLKDVRGLTPLYYCVAHNCNEECMEMLLTERATIGAQDEQGWFELHHACKQGLSQHLEHLLFYGADMEVQNASGNTPLHICGFNNKENCARLLLFRGANKEAVNYSNQTPYESALISQNHELSLIIENYKPEDVVPYRELPKYSKRRRNSIPSSALYGLFRSRSDPRVNIITPGDDAMYMSPSSSSNSLGYLNNNYPDTDSPCSMSVSSASSVTGVGDHGYWEGRNTNGQEGWFPSDHVQEVKLRRKAGSLGDIVKASRDTALNRNTLATLTRSYNHHEERTVILQRGQEGYGFVLRGAKSSTNATGELDFCPTAEFPALQYLDSVDPGSRSDRAGLKSGDFLLEINGENVVRATHDRVVQIIRQAGDTLKMKVVTVKPRDKQENWLQHQDGSMTLPNRGKRQAPQPPKRDPQTSISLTKSQGKQIAEGMAELETKKDNVSTQINPTTSDSKTTQMVLAQATSPNSAQIATEHVDKIGPRNHELDQSEPTSSSQVEPIYAKPLKRRLTHNKSFRAPLPPATEKNFQPKRQSLKVPPVTAPKPNRKSVLAPAPPDQLDKALEEYEMQGEVTQEQKTASIRSRHSAKRVSLVDVSSLESDQGQEKYMSPSEMRIKKYHHSKKQNGVVTAMERSRSTSDLLDGKKSEPVYATPVAVPGKASAKHQRSASGSGDITDKYNYDMSDNVSLKSSASYGGSTGKLSSPPNERPKAPPPPPGGSVPRRQAPPPPKGVEPITAAKTEVVSISTNRKSTSIYATPANIVPTNNTQAQDDSDYESSFRPGTSAKLSDEPKIKTKSLDEVKLKTHQRNVSASSKRSAASDVSQASEGSDKHSVSFADDKVLDSAKSFLQKHPNAQLLVTADVHTSKAQHSEPAPDYDLSDEDSPKPQSGKTIISIGERKQSTSALKQYTVKHSDIPESPQMKDFNHKSDVVIPPPPSEPAPKPPVTKTTRPASPATRPPPASVDVVRVTTEVSTEERKGETQVVPPPPPAPAPPPPPPPPVVPVEQNTTPVTPRKTMESQGNIMIPTGDIMAAVQKRQSRLQNEGLKITALGEKKGSQIDTQAALLAAVAKRRTALLQKSETEVVDEIEQRLNKSKKLQAAKYTFSSDNINKKDAKMETKPVEQKSKVTPKVSPTVEVKSTVQKENTSTASNMKPIFNSSNGTVLKPTSPTLKVAVTSSASKSVDKPKVEEKEPVKVSVSSSMTSDKLIAQQQSAKDKVKDFLAEAERAREEWLKKRSSTSALKPKTSESPKSETSQTTTVTTSTSRKISAPAPVKTSPAPAPAPVVNNRSVSVGNKTTSPVFSSEIISTKTEDKPKVNGVARTPSSVTHPVQKKSDTLGIVPVKGRDTELTTGKTSIRDRIANFEKNKGSGVINGRGRSASPMSPRFPIHGVTTDSSATDGKKNSTLPPPPPGFGDVVQVDIIPPPTSFQPQQDHDAASVVSSLSTLSTLSDEHADSGYSPSKHSYEEVIPPPPPGFDDSSNLNFDEIPTVIPPPPIFDSNEKNNNSVGLSDVKKPFISKTVDTWQCLDVLDWLDSLNMPQYKSSFQKHCIDGKKLVGLSRKDYIDLGVAQVGHRMNLERSIKKVSIRKTETS